MTRIVPPNLLTHFGNELTTVSMLWKIVRSDGVIMGFTNHDKDITYDGVTYFAATGFSPSDTAVKSDFSVSNLDLEGVLDSSSITEEDIINGVYDYAEVIIMLINYSNLQFSAFYPVFLPIFSRVYNNALSHMPGAD